MKKFIIITGSLVALVVPSAAMASQPADPGYFGTNRANNITNGVQGGYPDPSFIGEWFSGIAGDNGTTNQQWMVANNTPPVESALYTK
jgi:hypothetical protein